MKRKYMKLYTTLSSKLALQVSSLVALMQEASVDMLLLDLRDEDDFAQYHLQGGTKAMAIPTACTPS